MSQSKPTRAGWPSKPRSFHVMVKPRGSICNLDCQYCFYLKKEQLYPGAAFRMSDALLEEYTRQYIEAQAANVVTFAWQGGEPTLMGLDFYRKAAALQEKYRRPGMEIQNAFQTNGTLLDGEWCQFFKEHNFLVGISIDGPRPLHDAYRVDKGGQPTFDRVMRGMDLLKEYGVDFNTLTCVSASNAERGLEVYRFLRDEVGSRFLQFIPIVEREGAGVSRRTVSGPALGRFLIDVFDEWVRNDVGKVFVQMFDAALASWSGGPSGLCIFDETCGLGMAMEHNGDVYSCDHFVEPRFMLGNITEQPLERLLLQPEQYAFGQHKKESLPEYCRSCEVRFACNGGCPKDRLLRAPGGEPGLNYLCSGYRAFFNYIDAPMKMMRAQLNARRAPAEVMRVIASSPALRDTPPDALCPCGSRRAAGGCHAAFDGYTPAGHSSPPPARFEEKKKRH